MSDHRAILDAFFMDWNQSGPGQALHDHFVDDAVLWDSGMPRAAVGAVEISTAVEDIAGPRPRLQLDDILELNDFASAVALITMRSEDDEGNQVSQPAAALCVFRDNRLARFDAFHGAQGLLA